MPAFTVIKKGQEIAFESVFRDLIAAKNALSTSRNPFVQNLLSARNPSQKQIAWIHYEAMKTVTIAEADVSGQYINLVQRFHQMVGKGRRFRLHLPGNLRLQAVTNGANEGGIYISENGVYVGKITRNGVLNATVSEDTLNLLNECEDAPESIIKLAQMYGHESGQCSVCSRTLDDPKSIMLGIGPICLKRIS